MAESVDVAIIGSGVGGLTAAAMLARRGLNVAVFEQHTVPGGSASHFDRRGYRFDVGASLLYTLGTEGKANFLHRILNEIGEPIASVLDPIQIHYHLPEGLEVRAHYERERFLNELISHFPAERDAIRTFYDRLGEVFALMDSLDYISIEDAGAGLRFAFTRPVSAIRLALNSFKDLGSLARSLFTDRRLLRFIDLECYSWALAGADATPLINASIVIADRHVGGVRYPIGGVNQIAYALARGIEKHAGKIHYRTRVSRLCYEHGKVTGLILKNGTEIKARVVISNATAWNTAQMIGDEQAAGKLLRPYRRFTTSRSFFSLFCGIARAAVPNDYSTHHIVLEDWDRMEEDNGTIYISIPSILDASVAPPGYHNLHLFTVNSYEGWQYGKEYRARKSQSAEALVERLPFKGTPEFYIAATPLTNERYLARKQGSYGPLYARGKDLLFKPKNLTPIENLYCVGDSTFPGQGVSAVAASGLSCAMLIAKRFGVVWNR